MGSKISVIYTVWGGIQLLWIIEGLGLVTIYLAITRNIYCKVGGREISLDNTESW